MHAELVLLLGDIHLPHRSALIPTQFQKMLVPKKTQHVLCTGNLCTREQLDFLRSLSPSVHIVRGDMDEIDDLPEEVVIKIGDFKIGLCHGHQIIPWGDMESLQSYARQLDVDILVTGHTHQPVVTESGGRWFLNPGSTTGAWSGPSQKVEPSFMCLSIDGSKAMAFIYELENGEVKVRYSTYKKLGD